MTFGNALGDGIFLNDLLMRAQRHIIHMVYDTHDGMGIQRNIS
jgi:hypothetical protein